MFMVITQLEVELTTHADWIGRLDHLLHNGNVPVAVAITDLDGFAAINDTYGIEGGDRVLKVWETTLVRSVPAEAVVARLGGDEYSVALPAYAAESALILLQEIRTHYAEHGVNGIDDAVDASAGIAAAPPHGTTGEELYR